MKKKEKKKNKKKEKTAHCSSNSSQKKSLSSWKFSEKLRQKCFLSVDPVTLSHNQSQGLQTWYKLEEVCATYKPNQIITTESEK